MSDNESSEIAQYLHNSPPGTYRLYHGSGIGLEDSLEASSENYTEIRKLILHAVSSGCYIEVISLRLMIVDYWLRFFLRNSGYTGRISGLQLGHILSKAKHHGLDIDVCEKVQKFNDMRVKAVHGYIFGKTNVEEMAGFVSDTQFLVPEVIVYVIGVVGEVITALEGNFERGDKILNVQENIDYINSLGAI